MNDQVRVRVRFRDEAGNIITARATDPVTPASMVTTAIGGTLALTAMLFLLRYALLLLI